MNCTCYTNQPGHTCQYCQLAQQNLGAQQHSYPYHTYRPDYEQAFYNAAYQQSMPSHYYNASLQGWYSAPVEIDPLLLQAEKLLAQDPYLVRIEEELTHLLSLVGAKRQEVEEYKKECLEIIYNKLVKNKAFL